MKREKAEHLMLKDAPVRDNRSSEVGFPGRDDIDFTAREPLGAVARFVAFTHRFMFLAAKAAAPLAAGNTVIMKLPVQAPLGALRFAQLLGHLLPAGVSRDTSRHFLGAPFGGFKQSGIGRKEYLSELLPFTREKNVHIALRRRA